MNETSHQKNYKDLYSRINGFFFLNISKLYVIISNNDEMSTFLNFRLLMLIRYDVIKFL